MNDEQLNGRHVHTWGGRDPIEDLKRLTDAIVESIELFNHNGRLVQLDPDTGELMPVNRNTLHELINDSIAGLRLVRRDNGYEREYFSYRFAPTPHPGPPTAAQGIPKPVEMREPDAAVLDQIFRHELLWRVPRVE